MSVSMSSFVSIPHINEMVRGIFLVVQWLRIYLPMQGTRVRSLVRELRSHIPRGQLSLRPETTEPAGSKKDSAQPKTNQLIKIK